MASETIEVKLRSKGNFYSQHRLGRITLTMRAVLLNPEKTLQFMSNFLVLRTRESMSFMNDMEYIVASPLLPSIKEGEEIPEYDLVLHDWPTGETEIEQIRRVHDGAVVYDANQKENQTPT